MYYEDNESSSFLNIVLSIALHTSLVVVASTMTPPELFPEGKDVTRIEFITPGPAPLGEQLDSQVVAEQDSSAASIPEPPQVEPVKRKVEKPTNDVAVVSRPKKPATQKPKAQKKAAVKKTKKVIEKKAVKTAVVEDSDVIWEEENEPTPADEDLYDEESETEAAYADMNEGTEPKLIEEPNFDDTPADEKVFAATEVDRRMKELEEKATKEESFKPAIPTELPKKEITKQEPIPPTTAKALPEKAPIGKIAAAATTSKSYGVSKGIRDYRDLRQVPGNKPPLYPRESRFNKEMGETILMYYVTKTGQVTNLRVLKSSGHVRLDNEALKAVSQYRYVPGQAGNTIHPVRFDLKGNSLQDGGRLRTSSSIGNDSF